MKIEVGMGNCELIAEKSRMTFVVCLFGIFACCGLTALFIVLFINGYEVSLRNIMALVILIAIFFVCVVRIVYERKYPKELIGYDDKSGELTMFYAMKWHKVNKMEILDINYSCKICALHICKSGRVIIQLTNEEIVINNIKDIKSTYTKLLKIISVDI